MRARGLSARAALLAFCAARASDGAVPPRARAASPARARVAQHAERLDGRRLEGVARVLGELDGGAGASGPPRCASERNVISATPSRARSSSDSLTCPRSAAAIAGAAARSPDSPSSAAASSRTVEASLAARGPQEQRPRARVLAAREAHERGAPHLGDVALDGAHEQIGRAGAAQVPERLELGAAHERPRLLLGARDERRRGAASPAWPSPRPPSRARADRRRRARPAGQARRLGAAAWRRARAPRGGAAPARRRARATSASAGNARGPERAERHDGPPAHLERRSGASAARSDREGGRAASGARLTSGGTTRRRSACRAASRPRAIAANSAAAVSLGAAASAHDDRVALARRPAAHGRDAAPRPRARRRARRAPARRARDPRRAPSDAFRIAASAATGGSAARRSAAATRRSSFSLAPATADERLDDDRVLRRGLERASGRRRGTRAARARPRP